MPWARLPDVTEGGPKEPSEPSYTQKALEAQERLGEPPGAFWSLLVRFLAVGFVLLAYGLIWVSPLLRFLPRLPRKKNK